MAQLELFGSAARDGFAVGSSDIGFLIRFRPYIPEEHAERYFGLLADLQDFFDCDIDLVEIAAVPSLYFLDHIKNSRTGVYAA